jgi:hypothetical protein
MTKAKRAPRNAGLTRLELAAALGMSPRKIDRLVAAGLAPVAGRGPAKLYSVAAARTLAATLAPKPAAQPNVLIDDYRSHAEDLHARTETLRAEHVAVRDVMTAWRKVVAVIEEMTSTWPTTIARRVEAARAAGEMPRLLAADGPRPRPIARHDEWPAGDKLVKELLADRAGWPRLEADVIARAAARGVSAWCIRSAILRRGVETRDGRLFLPAPDFSPLDPAIQAAVEALDDAEAERRAAPPVVRPLLERLADEFPKTPAMRALDALLTPPPPTPPPAAPTTVDAARAQWRAARAALRRAAVRTRRGHVRRDIAVSAIEKAMDESRLRFFRWQAVAATSAGTDVRGEFERWRHVALAPLHALRFTPREGADAMTTEPTPAPTPAGADRERRRAARRSRSSSTTTNAQKPMPPRRRRRGRRPTR